MTRPNRLKSSPSRIVIVRVELTPAAKRQTVAVADRFGMTQIAALSRLAEWFTGQPEAVQRAVLSPDAEDRGPDATRRILERMAAGPVAPPHRA